jgi:hypothetical protein
VVAIVPPAHTLHSRALKSGGGEGSKTGLEFSDAQVLDTKYLPLVSFQVPQIAVVISHDLKMGLVERSDLTKFSHMITKLTFCMVPSVVEGSSVEVEVEAYIGKLAVTGDVKEGESCAKAVASSGV